MSEPTIIDRSTLERYAVCPAQGRAYEDGVVTVGNTLTEAGNAVHAAFSEAITAYIESQMAASAADLAQTMEQSLALSRPDIQPEAIRAAKYALWPFAKLLAGDRYQQPGIHAANILHYDGGEGQRCGQLAYDMEGTGLRLTCEVDLLYVPGKTPDVLRLLDYKSGYRQHTAQSVADSFQFQFYAAVIMHNYPDVQAVEVQVWNTRINRLTHRVVFERSDLHAIECRIDKATEHRWRTTGKAWQECETWPMADKCGMCDLAAMCSGPSQPITQLMMDPGAYLDDTVRLAARVAMREKLMAGYVDHTGKDIVSASGNCFGVNKPATNRKPTKTIYTATNTEGDE